MPQWLITALSTILPSLFVAVCTAYITVRLSLRQFHAQWWWERKAEAYSRIVEALHHGIEYCSAKTDETMTGQEISEEREKQLREEYGRATCELRKALGIGAYIISDEVAKALARLEAPPQLDPDEASFFELYDADCAAYKEALAEVRRLAKKDLGV